MPCLPSSSIDPPSAKIICDSCHGSATACFENRLPPSFPPESAHIPTMPTPPSPAVSWFPLYQLSENVTEHDICSLVLSVAVRLSQPFVDETGVQRVLFAEEPQPQPRPPTAKRMGSGPFIETAGQQNAKLTNTRSVGLLPGKVEEVKTDQVCVDNAVASADMHKSLLPEMLRVQEWFVRWGGDRFNR